MKYLKGVSILVAVVFITAIETNIAVAQQNATRSSVTNAADQHQMLNKQEAKDLLIQKYVTNADLNKDPEGSGVMICVINNAVENAYTNNLTLDQVTLGARFWIYMNEIYTDKSKEIDMMRCIVKSPALAAAVKEDDLKKKAATGQVLPLLDMDDLRVDMASLKGRKVRVRGVGFYMMDMFMLKKSMSDMSPMFVDTSKLAREQRKEIISRCGDMMSGCSLIVQGTVGKVSYQNGLMAEQVEFR
jgi:hypothetical protein